MPALPYLLTGLTPREAIIDAIHRCLQAFDLNNYPLFESAIHASATLNMNGTIYTGTAEIKSFFQHIASLDTTHTLSNVRIDVKKPDATTARVTCTNINQHFRKGEGLRFDEGKGRGFWGGANYEMEVVREEKEKEEEEGWDGLWRVKEWVLVPIWGEGDIGTVLPGKGEGKDEE